jgi:outer membrane lipoprotein LolB
MPPRTALHGPLRAARTALLVLALAVTGCATWTPIGPSEREYSGRFAASILRGDERESVSGNFRLAIHRDGTTLDLASPLGNTLARVQTAPERATLTAPQADGTLATREGDSAEALAESVLGFRLPVSGLADWISGRAVPGRPALVSPENGPAQRIEQDGWLIVIDERFEDGGAPRRLSFDRSAQAAAEPAVRLRLVLDWRREHRSPH